MNPEYYNKLLDVIRDEASQKVKYFREVEDTKSMQESQAIQKSIPEKNRSYLRASEIGDCIRKLYFRLSGVIPDPIEPEKVYPYLDIAAEIGNTIHNKILSDKSIYMLTEYSFSYDDLPLSIHGRLDGLTHDGIIVEVKTIDDINRSDIPKKEHIAQLSLYIFLAQKLLPDIEIRGAELKYVSRGKINMKSFPFNLDEMRKVYTLLLNKISKLSNYLIEHKVPSLKDQFIDKSQCRFCEFKSTCQRLNF